MPEAAHPGLSAIVLVLALVAAAPAQASRCVDEQSFDAGAAATAGSAAAPAMTADARSDLRTLVEDALVRSQAVGAAKLSMEAAQQDTAEARAARELQANLNGNIGPQAGHADGVNQPASVRANAGVSFSRLLYDGGRSDRQVDWRAQLAESARQGHLNLQEQIALSAVSLALERSRYRMQAQVYGQHVRKMGCLVDALEQIVNADKGRLSELVQARKSLQQAELSQTQAVSGARQVEVRLRRLVGDGLPGTPGLASVFLRLPDVAELQLEAAQSAEIAQYDAQAEAMANLSQNSGNAGTTSLGALLRAKLDNGSNS